MGGGLGQGGGGCLLGQEFLCGANIAHFMRCYAMSGVTPFTEFTHSPIWTDLEA